MSLIRVAFVFEVFSTEWTGGINYYLNLIRTTSTRKDSHIQIIIFAGYDVNLHGMEAYAQVIRCKLLDKKNVSRKIRKVIQKILKIDLFLYGLLKLHKINCLSHFDYLWKGSSIPTLCWIADFQHKRLPDFFDSEQIKRRDKDISSLLQYGDAILLSSNSAAKDLENYYPSANKRKFVLQFVTAPPASWQPQPKHQLQNTYQLPEKWFHIPNQFWTHKNHKAVIAALNTLKQRGINPLVVATGHTVDFRHPNHFASLTQQLVEFDLKDSFRILGSIPYEDMLSLMYYSIAVINPSLFEGWSTTVEEAKSMGKRILLSDIDVHREQLPKRASYFGPQDPSQLADLMEITISKYDIDKENQQNILALDETILRQEEFAKTYEDIIIKLITNT